MSNGYPIVKVIDYIVLPSFFINYISQYIYEAEFFLFADDLKVVKSFNSTLDCALLNYLNR